MKKKVSYKRKSTGAKNYLISETKPLTTGPAPVTYNGKEITIEITIVD
jgi:hypothetical protein